MSRTCARTSGPMRRRAWWKQRWCREGGSQSGAPVISGGGGQMLGSVLVELAVISMVNTSAHARSCTCVSFAALVFLTSCSFSLFSVALPASWASIPQALAPHRQSETSRLRSMPSALWLTDWWAGCPPEAGGPPRSNSLAASVQPRSVCSAPQTSP